MASAPHRRSKYLNNRAENSHQPTRHRERAMTRFTSIRHAQRFLSAFSGIWPHFRSRRHLLSAADHPTADGRPLRGRQRDHRGDDRGRRLNRRLGQDAASKPTAHHPESSHQPMRLAQVDSAGTGAGSRDQPQPRTGCAFSSSWHSTVRRDDPSLRAISTSAAGSCADGASCYSAVVPPAGA
jgi:hypothetical protein